jgi:hypothetical protein
LAKKSSNRPDHRKANPAGSAWSHRYRLLPRRIAGEEEGATFSTALVELGGGLVPAFIVEELEGYGYAVFIPDAPNPMSGALHFMPSQRVHPIDIPFGKVVICLNKWGAGSRDLFKAMRQFKYGNQ